MLLNIFHYFLNASPQLWPRLVHICPKWRHIVFANASQQALYLRLFYTHGKSVLKTLDCWPALPIVLEYGGSPTLDPPAPEDEDNIVAALKQYDRVSSIHLTISASLLEKLLLLKEPFSNWRTCLFYPWMTCNRPFPAFFNGPTPQHSSPNWDRLTHTPSSPFIFQGPCRYPASRNREYFIRFIAERLVRDDPASISLNSFPIT